MLFRRSSGCLTLAAMLAGQAGKAMPVDVSSPPSPAEVKPGTCPEDDAVATQLQAHFAEADPFCRAFGPEVKEAEEIVDRHIAQTVDAGSITTTTVTVQNTMVITAMADYLITATPKCGDPVPTPASGNSGGGGGGGGRKLQPPAAVAVGRGSGQGQAPAQAQASTQAKGSVQAQASTQAKPQIQAQAPTQGEAQDQNRAPAQAQYQNQPNSPSQVQDLSQASPQAANQDQPQAQVQDQSQPKDEPHAPTPAKAIRDVQTPYFVAGLDDTEISRACACFLRANNVPATVTAAVDQAIRAAAVPTATVTFTKFADEPVRNVVTVGATRTVFASCTP